MKPRVVFLSNYPVPYQLELLAAVEARGELEVTPLFLAPADPGRQWADGEGPHARTLPGFPASLRPELRLHPTLVKELYAARPELAIVCGYSYATFQAALLALSAARVPTLLWAEVPRLDEGNLMRRLVRRALLAPVRLVRGVLAVGSRAATAWSALPLTSRSWPPLTPFRPAAGPGVGLEVGVGLGVGGGVGLGVGVGAADTEKATLLVLLLKLLSRKRCTSLTQPLSE